MSIKKKKPRGKKKAAYFAPAVPCVPSAPVAPASTTPTMVMQMKPTIAGQMVGRLKQRMIISNRHPKGRPFRVASLKRVTME